MPPSAMEWAVAILLVGGIVGTVIFAVLYFIERRRYDVSEVLEAVRKELANLPGMVERDALRVILELETHGSQIEKRLHEAIQALHPARAARVSHNPSPERSLAAEQAEATRARIKAVLRAKATEAGRNISDADLEKRAMELYAEHGAVLR